jgi:hypothetical protein
MRCLRLCVSVCGGEGGEGGVGWGGAEKGGGTIQAEAWRGTWWW